MPKNAGMGVSQKPQALADIGTFEAEKAAKR